MNKDKQLKAKKQPAVTVEHRVKLVLPDGSLVVNRKCEAWLIADHPRVPDFIPYTLDRDAAEHGVKVLSWAIEGNDVVAKVNWL